MAATPKTAKPEDELVSLELNPSSGVDVLGDGAPPLLWVGVSRGFTEAEARDLLALRNSHGVPICRISVGAE